MSKKRFNLSYPISHDPIPSWVNIIHDDMEHKHLNAKEIVDLLNEQQGIIEEKNNIIALMGAFIKSNGFSIDDFNEWISKDWYK